ncbi:cytochrome P450 [Podospora aff. communis PSN243]|uniref:Cytochrome P450 n=1 Tax=Podospora aff. communis PSN243 TaxID=3040156 RepID=A0AAV9GYP5_9PEZI|nr:cytochrome P450 [Podospora aff. communis PSN243]
MGSLGTPEPFNPVTYTTYTEHTTPGNLRPLPLFKMKHLKHLALAILGAPLSAWILYTSNATILSSTANLFQRVLALLFSLLTFKTNVSLIQTHLFTRRALALGCAPAPMIPHADPILGLDAFFETFRAIKENRLAQHFASLFVKYGNTHYSLALGNKMLVTCDRENIKTALTTKFDDFPIGGPRLNISLLVLGSRSVFSSNGATWHEARSMIRPSFVRDQVSDFACFNKHISKFLAVVPSDGATFDMQELLYKLTMDSSTDFMLGYSTNSLVHAEPEATQFLHDFEWVNVEASKLARLGSVLVYLPHRKLSAAIARLRDYIRFYIRKVVAENEKKDLSKAEDRSYVFLDELLKANAPEEYVIDQVLSVIVAGRDTTAVSMASVFWCLARDPEAVRRLKAEIKQVGVDEPSWETLRGMKFLNNVIKESLRLFPPIAINARAANKETVLPRGGGPDGTQPVLLPKGTPIRWSVWSLHRNKEVYGTDADEFRPDRWETLRVGWDYIPFSGGPRICIGQQFALSQMALILYRFFREFPMIEAREEGGPFMKAAVTFSFLNGCLVGIVGSCDLVRGMTAYL